MTPSTHGASILVARWRQNLAARERALPDAGSIFRAIQLGSTRLHPAVQQELQTDIKRLAKKTAEQIRHLADRQYQAMITMPQKERDELISRASQQEWVYLASRYPNVHAKLQSRIRKLARGRMR